MNELRKDYLLDRWVLIAANRGKRPHELAAKRKAKEEPKVCFFCRGNEQLTPKELDRIGKAGRWEVRVVPNMFPATSLDFPKAYGTHEVIIETPEHNKNMQDFEPGHIKKIFDMYSRRTEASRRTKGIKYALVFKNHGEEAGTSLPHEHAQLVSSDKVPTLVEQEIRAYRRYRAGKKRCPYCEIMRREMKSKRGIYEDKHIACFAPYASRFPFEAWLLPKRHVKSLAELSDAERYALARGLKRILKKLDERLNDPPYNFYLHTAPFNEKDFHFHIEICPRLTRLAGFELGSDIVINITPPEEAARLLK